MQPVIYADLRCLQDPKYRVRGIGQHVAALLRTRKQCALSKWKMVGLVDPRSPQLPEECASWVDEVSSSVNPCCNEAAAVFIDGTPMTHDTRFSVRFQSHPVFFCAAVIYDFIPLEWPGYLPSVSNRIDYLGKMARLRNFDFFLPISEYTAWRTSALLGVSRDRIRVTGASVRRSLYDLADVSRNSRSPYKGEDPYFLVILATDARKNPEAAIQALRHLNLLYSRRIALKIVGHYDDAFKQRLLWMAGHNAGEGFLEFHPDISDEELVTLFAGAIATIAPSHIEGFSLPVVEASVCGCPAVASTCAAHLELITHPQALFRSDDPAGLCQALEALLNEPALRAELVASQASLRDKFHEDFVGDRFWSALEGAVDRRYEPPSILRRAKPRLAFLSPYPPDQSGVARYTAMTMRAGEKFFHSDIYTDAPRPLTFEGDFQDAGKISLAPLITGNYNGVISVLGNSHFHTRIFEIFERYGGPCILHDARLIQIYVQRFGQQEFLKFAGKLLGRSLTMEEIHAWLHTENPPSLLLEPVIERAAPLIVHTATQKALIKARHGVDAEVTTCCPTIFFRDEELTLAEREKARQRLGISASTFLVSSFGIVGPEKGMDTCVLASELLRSWNIPAELYFAGNANIHKPELDRIARLYGIGEFVHTDDSFVDDETYRDFLIASDAAVQLRNYGFGQLSAALTDCISAGLSCVANNDLARSCDAPSYVAVVPDRFSPLQVAEQLALIWEAQSGAVWNRDARAAYLETHNFEYYAKRLIEILGIA
jgi:glycosyltransferase involved in cell wall biosynthesis